MLCYRIKRSYSSQQKNHQTKNKNRWIMAETKTLFEIIEEHYDLEEALEELNADFEEMIRKSYDN